MITTMCARVQFDSTTLVAARYDEKEILQLDFRDGTRYLYSGVAPSVYEDMLSSDSKGSFFNRYIRGRFAYVKLSSEN